MPAGRKRNTRDTEAQEVWPIKSWTDAGKQKPREWRRTGRNAHGPQQGRAEHGRRGAHPPGSGVGPQNFAAPLGARAGGTSSR